MKVKFLGTSHGVPMPGRYCQSILIEIGEAAYVIDSGAPVMDILINEGYDLTKIKGIFITHMHGDHLNGLPDIITLASWYYKNMSFDVFLPEQRGIDVIKDYCSMRLYSNADVDRIRYHLFKDGLVYEDENVKINAFSTDHMEATSDISYGFLVEADGKKTYITGDLHSTLKDFREFLYDEEIDLLITECAHFSAGSLCQKLKKCKAKKTAVIHVFPKDQYEKLAKLEVGLTCKMLYPNDGEEFIL